MQDILCCEKSTDTMSDEYFLIGVGTVMTDLDPLLSDVLGSDTWDQEVSVQGIPQCDW